MRIPWKLVLRWLAILLVLVVVTLYLTHRGTTVSSFTTAKVTQGPIVRSVTATGTVNPVITVQVGSYVSGPIQAIYADFNSPVKQGQLIAKIDPRPFQVKVDQSKAALANARAQLGKDKADLVYKKLTFERYGELIREDAISRDQLDSARSGYQQAQSQVALDEANIQQQQANLSEAEVNLGYTSIISPVDGTIVSRNVDVGQTVAASFQTPTLFLIAKDLTKMQVDTNVSESDVGDVRVGQEADFHVDAFPDRTFQGVVGQVRQAPITVQNVVTYDVVINVANPELLLKPGMTANVTVVTAHRDQAMRVPDDALRFVPPGERAQPAAEADASFPRKGRVWVLNGGGIRSVAITIGLDDGRWVEVLSGDIHPGDQVVTGESRSTHQTSQGSAPHFPH